MTDSPRCEWPIRRIVRGQVVEGPPCRFQGRLWIGYVGLCNTHRRMLQRALTSWGTR